MTILDLGSGERGTEWKNPSPDKYDSFIMVDIDAERCLRARQNFPDRLVLQGSGENIPLPDLSVDCITCGVALPYMNIPVACKEMFRVLKKGGYVSVSLHRLSFTISEFQKVNSVKSFIGRLTVILNGLLFHFTGRLAYLPSCESFQTKKSFRRAMLCAGFKHVDFKFNKGQFLATAVKEN